MSDSPSSSDPADIQEPVPIEGRRLAVTAQALYLLNLLFPLLPLLALAGIAMLHSGRGVPLARNHLRQGLAGAILSSLLFIAANLLIITQGGYRSMAALVVFELYYVLVVPLLLVPGLIGILRAISGREFQFPLLGRFL